MVALTHKRFKKYAAIAIGFLTLAIAIIFYLSSRDQDHLMPDDGSVEWGVPLPPRIAERLKPELTPDTLASVIVNPELAIEKYVTGVRKVGADYKIFGADLDNSDGNIRRCELHIRPTLGELLVRLWQRSLKGTSSRPQPSLGLDGTDYYFAAPVGGKELTGRTWSPQTPKMRRLVAIASVMKNLCQLGDVAGLTPLEYQVNDALAH